MNVSPNGIKKITILLADDHQMLLDLWASILFNDGRFDIVGKADNGILAVEMAKKCRPDIILLDINMGQLNGFEAAGLIRKFSPGSKIIGVSMFNLPAYAKKMSSLGAMGYVTKNSPVKELITAIIEVNKGNQYICKQIKLMMGTEDEMPIENKTNECPLTIREIEVVQMIRKGLTSKEIADKLNLSPKTINIHRYNIFRKLKVKSIATLITATQIIGL